MRRDESRPSSPKPAAGRSVEDGTLPAQARAFLAEKLIESLDAEPGQALSSAWRDEIRKRCREVDQGLVELRTAEAVFAEAYAALS
ncbi:MAG: addiction module protein [Candidatus Schekmanbacteria bacterium]|nr:addiction module protein [Candidatus Schekmanbacteria bacterium]